MIGISYFRFVLYLALGHIVVVGIFRSAAQLIRLYILLTSSGGSVRSTSIEA